MATMGGPAAQVKAGLRRRHRINDWPERTGGLYTMGTPTIRECCTDERLVAAVRGGDRSAFADLYVRYSPIAHRFAYRLLGSSDDAEDVVSEAFAKVLDRLLGGGGPTVAFHSYLLTTIRRTTYKRWLADRRIDRLAGLDQLPLVASDPLVDRLDVCLAARAFRSLSQRWRMVLWYQEVQNMPTATIARILDIRPNAVSALAFRAREALRLAYLQVHVNTAVDDRCRESAEHLVLWLCGRLARGQRSRVEQHVNECDRCSVAASEVGGLMAELSMTVPIVSN
jgi:RNA polymerase sigma factor (sigma-70 family)